MNGISRRLFICTAALVLLASLRITRAEDLPELAKIKAAAEAGDAVAQFKLAESFSMHADPEQAALWYRKACEQDYVPAQARFGVGRSPSHRFALINGKTLAVGETATIKLSGTAVAVRCVEIRTASVLISVEGTEGTQELGFK